MSETINNKNEISENTNNDSYNVLSEMKDNFDPANAENARREALEARHILGEDNRLKEEYAKSDLGQQEQGIEETFDQWYNDIDEMVKSGQLSEDDARQMLDSMLESGISGINAVRQEYATQQELADHEEVQRKLESKETHATDDFAGETNLNSKTGKERTFSEWDIQPKKADETAREFGNREINRNDITVLTEYIPMLQDEDAKHYSQRITKLHEAYPRADGETSADYRNRINEANSSNELLFTLANRTIDSDSPVAKQLLDDLNNIEDMQKAGRFDGNRKEQLQREVLEKAINANWKNEQQQEKADMRARATERLEIKQHEEVQNRLEEMEKGTAEEYAGETNLNSKTGKERTFSEWDIHPRMANETSQEFGDRQAKRNDMTILAEFVPRDTDPNLTSAENIKSYSEKVEAFRDKFPRNEGESLDDYRNRIRGLAENGSLVLTSEEPESTQELPVTPPESAPVPPTPKKRGPFGRIMSFFGRRRNKNNKAA